MKRLLVILISAFAFTTNVNALSYNEARDRAWYLTDKMAYELNLTEEQYDRAYEINLDYFLSVHSPNDIEGNYWRYRNTDFGHILFDWQYNLYTATSYFFRPLIIVRGAWVLTSYNFYNRNYYYFSRPIIYNVYRGRNWRHHARVNPYVDYRISSNRRGMRDRYIESHKHNAPRSNYRIERTPGRKYNYEWHNPGKQSYGNNYREQNHRNPGNIKPDNSRRENMNNSYRGNENSGSRNNHKYNSNGNNYRDKNDSHNNNNTKTNQPVLRFTQNNLKSTPSNSERKYSRTEISGGRNNYRETFSQSTDNRNFARAQSTGYERSNRNNIRSTNASMNKSTTSSRSNQKNTPAQRANANKTVRSYRR